MNEVMEYVGLAKIFQKKECKIDGKQLVYYEKVDAVFGSWYEFKNGNGKEFIILSGKNEGKTIDESSIFTVVDFKTLRLLCRENNYDYNARKFIEEYKKNIGCYYTYDSIEDTFKIITDEDLLSKIKGSSKEYDDSILKGGTDISQMYATIKKTIISQDEQIMQILTSLFKNQRVINSTLSDDMINKLKENIIIYGPTGTGKTEILKRIASIYNVPIVIEDATSLSETGFVGRKITDMLENLYLAAGKDIKKAEKGILVIDEFDKLSEKNSSQDHVSRMGVQRSLLKLLDGSTFYFNDKEFDTSKLSVIALGAFTGIVNSDDYSSVSSTDFVNYGIMRELMGRFSKLIAMNSLSKEDIKKILIESDFSPLNTYKLLFDSMNINFSYDDNFVDYIAEKAVILNSGARSLKTVVDDAISSAMFRIFAGEYEAINLTKPITNEGRPYVLKRKIK